MEFDNKEFGRRVAARRKSLHIKQTELAEKIGISNKHLSNIENGRIGTSIDVFINICNELSVTPAYLLEGAMHSMNVPQNIIDSLRLCGADDIDLVADFVRLLVERQRSKGRMT